MADQEAQELAAVAWMRRHPDGALSPNELLPHERCEPVRQSSGAWVPLCRLDEATAIISKLKQQLAKQAQALKAFETANRENAINRANADLRRRAELAEAEVRSVMAANSMLTERAEAAEREPLSDEQVVNALQAAGLNLAFRNYEQDIECARAIEAAHGIKSADGE